jgi:hypothetical protein
MALAFFSSPECPVKCALEISAGIRKGSDLKLRMGVHSGPVYRVEDIRGEVVVAGSGINMAQRVMDCGDAGHILLSSTIAEVLIETTGWAKCIYKLGEVEAKHGVRLRIFSLYVGEDGNRTLPQKFQRPSTDLICESSSSTGKTGSASISQAHALRPFAAATAPNANRIAPKKIMLAYKRGSQPDEALLNFLEINLKELGHSVFIDRHLRIGMEWAKEIERQVVTADALIPLLSAASIQSEMLTYEVQLAFQASEANAGKPCVLPVRVNYDGPLSADLATFLDPIQYVIWHGPEDNS